MLHLYKRIMNILKLYINQLDTVVLVGAIVDNVAEDIYITCSCIVYCPMRVRFTVKLKG